MKRTDLLRQLRAIAAAKCQPIAVWEGGSHTRVRLGPVTLTVPRHRELNELTARGILADAETVPDNCKEG